MKHRIVVCHFMLVAFAAATGGCAVAGDDPTSTQSDELVAKPDVSAFVLTVSGLDGVRVTGGGQDSLCDSQCSYAFLGGTAVTVKALGNLADCEAFSSWTGACAGQGALCNLVINSDLSTFANLKSIPGCRPK
ncbi:MAG TPA: hypothetical protein VFP84_27865 [Kofleriaceae bacterium]|nr:hypothetical protein [Kofleriaceae bacterium]